MNFLDITSYVTVNKYICFLLLIIGNMELPPSAVLLFMENGISLKDEIYSTETLEKICAPVMGETMAFLLFNVLFAMLDWHNYGYSFIIGLVWIWAYKKTGHLIAPMIAHGGSVIVYLFYYLIS
ncbi:MAG: CPBP family intramembrane metalloprotease [Oscillospiraceae bacterium]|nr:CPBP family intramembrane metalloprotease [Oscillospiraceae bacterium]